MSEILFLNIHTRIFKLHITTYVLKIQYTIKQKKRERENLPITCTQKSELTPNIPSQCNIVRADSVRRFLGKSLYRGQLAVR
jgi:hypothetical protein